MCCRDCHQAAEAEVAGPSRFRFRFRSALELEAQIGRLLSGRSCPSPGCILADRKACELLSYLLLQLLIRVPLLLLDLPLVAISRKCKWKREVVALREWAHAGRGSTCRSLGLIFALVEIAAQVIWADIKPQLFVTAKHVEGQQLSDLREEGSRAARRGGGCETADTMPVRVQRRTEMSWAWPRVRA